ARQLDGLSVLRSAPGARPGLPIAPSANGPSRSAGVDHRGDIGLRLKSLMRCKSCHYSLANLTEHRCPECGRHFDPSDPTTFDVLAKFRRSRKRRKILLLTAALIWQLVVWSLTVGGIFIDIYALLGIPWNTPGTTKVAGTVLGF